MNADTPFADDPERQADAIPLHVPMDPVVADWLVHVAGEALQVADILDPHRTGPPGTLASSRIANIAREARWALKPADAYRLDSSAAFVVGRVELIPASVV